MNEQAYFDSQQFLAGLTPDSLESLDIVDLRRACQLVLKRDIGPITDSTRSLYILAVKRSLIGHPISESNNESNPEVPSESDSEESNLKEKSHDGSFALPSPTLSSPSPPRIINRKSSPLITRKSSPLTSPYTSIKKSSPSTPVPPFSRPPPGQQQSNFLRNTFIIGIGAVLAALIFAFLLSD